jgi:hypothetical protein
MNFVSLCVRYIHDEFMCTGYIPEILTMVGPYPTQSKQVWIFFSPVGNMLGI